MKRNLLFSLGLALLLSLPTFAQNASVPKSAAAQAVNSGSVYDRQIQEDVTKYLRGDDKLKDVSASTEDGIVTLTGKVDLLKYKLDAQKKISKKGHVAGVKNQIEVAGKTVADESLRDSLAEKLRYDRVNLGNVYNSLNIGVNGGVATVSGNVRTGADKESALSEIENTPGVKGLVDEIKIAPASNYDDSLRLAIARKIYSRLPMYANDPQAPIRIVVENGRVGLFGVVNSQVDKQVAESQARSTPGVFSVTNHLVVENGKQG